MPRCWVFDGCEILKSGHKAPPTVWFLPHHGQNAFLRPRLHSSSQKVPIIVKILLDFDLSDLFGLLRTSLHRL